MYSKLPVICHLIIWQLTRVVPGLELLLFTKKIFISETGRPQGQVQKGIQECVYINHSGIFGTPCLLLQQVLQL